MTTCTCERCSCEMCGKAIDEIADCFCASCQAVKNEGRDERQWKYGYHQGLVAGRLAVYRGDVEQALLDPNVGLLVVLPRHERHVASLEHELAHDLLEVDRRIAERDLGWARAYVRQLTMQIADLTRWLEATQ